MAMGLAQSATYNLSIQFDRAEKETAKVGTVLDLLDWAYRVQRVYQDGDTVDDRRYLLGGNPLASLERLHALGCQVDGGGHSISEPHRDAVAVHDVVCDLARLSLDGQVAAGLIVEHARAGRVPVRPELEGVAVEPVRSRGGAVRMVYHDWETGERLAMRSGRMLRGGAGNVCRVGQACEVKYNQECALNLYLIEHSDLWAMGLAYVAGNLHRLKSWKVQSYQCPAEASHTKPAARLKKLIDLHLAV
ncbi:hypothetical protein [uncultured Cohaesibacter sp.]|uniref:hypothetical protein n=1 Tax=uncultured Cohaesibacter sp. TaxID=1002546 RepID=UPI0029C86BCC|nr:hypothetical protein [uncultured Cohaesibacter sp.]